MTIVGPFDFVFECEPPETDTAFIVIRDEWRDGQRVIKEWRYPTDEERLVDNTAPEG